MAPRKGGPTPPSQEEAATFDVLEPMLKSAHEEMRELSKKKPDAVLTPTKAAFINQLLRDARVILASDPSAEYLDTLNEEELPENSDATMLIGRYLAAMQMFRGRYHDFVRGWDTAKRRSD